MKFGGSMYLVRLRREALRILSCLLLMSSLISVSAEEEEKEEDTVVLLHGLARSSRSMLKMERALEADGYRVLNIGYPSREYTVEELARRVRRQIVAEVSEESRLHFVTHSLGGIIVRWMQQEEPLPRVHRMVMLSPPNHGSEVVDTLGDWRLFRWVNGPAGSQLGTGEDGIAARLGAPDFEVGVITGDRSINWILSRYLPGKDDGKVSVASARLEAMRDFRVVHTAHPFIMKNRRVISATRHFLAEGRFPEAGL